MWEYEYIYLQYFSHSLAVTVASRVAVAVVSQVSDHILYCHDFILSALQLERAKSYRVVLCQPNFNFILYFVPYRNNQIYKKGQSQRLKWLGQHNNNRGLLKEQTGLTNLQN